MVTGLTVIGKGIIVEMDAGSVGIAVITVQDNIISGSVTGGTVCPEWAVIMTFGVIGITVDGSVVGGIEGSDSSAAMPVTLKESDNASAARTVIILLRCPVFIIFSSGKYDALE